jgi:hypothetical protein
LLATAYRILALAILLVAATPNLCEAAGQIPYGSRTGMSVTIRQMDGIDTDRASIRVEHTRENAKEYCADYLQDPSEACIENALKSVRINDALKGNCRTGQFVNLRGEHRTFAGANLDHDAIPNSPEYAIFKEGERTLMPSGNAAGYLIDLEQFKALCPAKFGQAMGSFETRPKFIGRWYTVDKKVCHEPDGAAEGLLTYKAREFIAVESICKFTNMRMAGNHYDISMRCASEGEESSSRETVEADQRKLVRTVTVGRKQMTFSYDRCPL